MVVGSSEDPNERMMVDLWQTGGPLASCDQGGDDELLATRPRRRGIAFRLARLHRRSDPESRGWHVTKTIDIDLMLSGTMLLSVPDSPPVTL